MLASSSRVMLDPALLVLSSDFLDFPPSHRAADQGSPRALATCILAAFRGLSRRQRIRQGKRSWLCLRKRVTELCAGRSKHSGAEHASLAPLPLMALCAQQLAACDTCFLLKPVEEYARPDGRWETACLACRNSAAHAAKRARIVADGEAQHATNQRAATASPDDEEAPGSQVHELMRLDLFQAALGGTSPESARALMRQLLDLHGRGRLGAEAAADVALAYLAQHVQQAPQQQQQQQLQQGAAAAAQEGQPKGAGGPAGGPGGQQQGQGPPGLAAPPTAGQQQRGGGPGPGQQQPPMAESPGQQQQPPQQGAPIGQASGGQQQGGQQQQLRAAQQAAVDAVPAQMLRLIVDLPAQRPRQRLFALARRCPPLLGQLLCASDPSALLSEGHLSSADLLAALQQPPGQPALPALAAVAAAAALLAAAPPGPSPQLLHLVRILAEGHQLMALVEAGHLAPGELRAALAGAPPEAFTDIFKSMCTNDAAGQSFLKQAMQRAMPRADYGELMRISMLAEVARTAATVTDRGTLLGLLEKAFAA